ncbi:glycosyltransferase [Salininema proteolyticum]|uniref:Glycosyltransferase n=1 Tax=Salininema proteolyticum TaxID=1607685 RepID=A0ABV8TXT0_9ACTN
MKATRTPGPDAPSVWEDAPPEADAALNAVADRLTGPDAIDATAANALATRSRIGRHALAIAARRGRRRAELQLARVLAVQPLAEGDRRAARDLFERGEIPDDAGLRETYARLIAETAPDDLGGVRLTAETAAALDLKDAVNGGGDVVASLEACTGWTGMSLGGESGEAASDGTLGSRKEPGGLDGLRGPALDPVKSGPLISIIMSCYRPDRHIATAVRSVIAQSWQRWELVVVDDCSGPEHDGVLSEIAGLDDRVRVLRQPYNLGTYAARNRALDEVRGSLVTGLDSDDWAHPSWLADQAAPLLDDPELMMTMSRAVRLGSDLAPFVAPGLKLFEHRSTSAMFRRDPVRERIGYYDWVRKGADSEFRLRIQKRFGAKRTVRLDAVHTVLRVSGQSLSAGEIAPGWLHPSRKAYESAFSHWQQFRRGRSRLARNVWPRPFYAPTVLLDPLAAQEFDEVYIADWSEDAPLRSGLMDRAVGSARRGRRVALAHYPDWTNPVASRRYAKPVLETALREGLEWADPAASTDADWFAADEATALFLSVEHGKKAAAPPGLEVREPHEGPGVKASLPAPVRKVGGRLKRVPAKAGGIARRAAVAGTTWLPGRARRKWGSARHDLEFWRQRLYGGFSRTAGEELRKIAENPALRYGLRKRAAQMLDEFYTGERGKHRRGGGVRDRDREDGRAGDGHRADAGQSQNPPSGPGGAISRGVLTPPHRREIDVLFVSNFCMPGGTSTSNAAEMRALADAGLTVGLLHHPVYDWRISRDFNPKIRALLDEGAVEEVAVDEPLRVGLQIVRFPRVMAHPLEDRPDIEADDTVLVVNQAPYEYYADRGKVLTWDPSPVFNGLTDWAGAHRWFLQGPQIRRALEADHARETAAMPVDDEYWYGFVDVEDWRREGRRAGGGAFRIGRHARDAAGKWPQRPETLLAAYPDDEGIEVRVLGGAAAAAKVIGGDLPDNWTVEEFGSRGAREFLHDLDALVFFRAETGTEAFGRTILEGMASGLPCVVAPEFTELFGPGAIVCEPEEVRDVLEKLRNDEEYYREASRRALDHVRRSFSTEAYVDRVGRLHPSLGAKMRARSEAGADTGAASAPGDGAGGRADGERAEPAAEDGADGPGPAREPGSGERAER